MPAPTTTTGVTSPHPPLRVRLLSVPGCPLIDQVRAAVQHCLRTTGIPAVVEDIEGSYPSPTLLIDGVDVATGQAPIPHACCRLDLPTHAQITAALHKGATR